VGAGPRREGPGRVGCSAGRIDHRAPRQSVSVTWPRSIVGRVGQLLAGLVVSATGIWMTIRAELGVAPWEVLHIGLADRLDVGVGTASIAVGLVLVVLVTAFAGAASPPRGGSGVASPRPPVGHRCLRLRVRDVRGRPSGSGTTGRAHGGRAPLWRRTDRRGPRAGRGSGPVAGRGPRRSGGVGTTVFVLSAGPAVESAFRALGLRPLRDAP
jgi:hypothetical protein